MGLGWKMDFIKDVFSAAGSRLRSHFFGSILISLIFFNWKPIIYLIYAETSVLTKFVYVEKNWQFCWPFFVGILVALATPYIVWAGARIARHPSEKLKELQDDAKHKRTITLIRFQTSENKVRIESAKQVDDALKLIKDQGIRNRLVDDVVKRGLDILDPNEYSTEALDESMKLQKANLSIRLEKDADNSWRVILTNLGPNEAYNVNLELTDANEFLRHGSIERKLPLEKLESGQTVTFPAFVHLNSHAKEDVTILWDDNESSGKRTVTTLTL